MEALSEMERRGQRQRLVAIVGPAVVTAAVGIATLLAGRTAVDRERSVVHTQEVQLGAADLLQRLTDAETGERGYLLTGEDIYLVPYTGATADAKRDLERLRVFTRDNPRQQPRLDSLAVVVDRRLAVLDSLIAVRRAAGGPIGHLGPPLGRGRALMARARVIAAAITAEEARLMTVRQAGARAQRTLTAIVLIAGTLLAMAIGVMVSALLSAQTAQLASQNARLRTLGAELERQNEQLLQQASELEQQADEMQSQAAELEASNADLSSTNEALSDSNRQLETALADVRRARDAADAANRAKGDFLATMSHELRTPLNAIGGYVDLLLAGVRGPLAAQQNEDLERIRRAGRHLLGLINDVLNFAKLEAGEGNAKSEPVPIPELVATASGMVEPQAAAKGIVFLTPPVDGAVIARGDRDKMLQIVLNLLSNAIKFTRRGEITLAARSAPGQGGEADVVEITVQDTGLGIPHDQLERIFEPFVQVRRRLAGDDEGVGLGLAISRDLARAMGGDVTVESTLDEGSIFTLRVPHAEQ